MASVMAVNAASSGRAFDTIHEGVRGPDQQIVRFAATSAWCAPELKGWDIRRGDERCCGARRGSVARCSSYASLGRAQTPPLGPERGLGDVRPSGRGGSHAHHRPVLHNAPVVRPHMRPPKSCDVHHRVAPRRISHLLVKIQNVHRAERASRDPEKNSSCSIQSKIDNRLRGSLENTRT
jgi:hypothetical protein